MFKSKKLTPKVEHQIARAAYVQVLLFFICTLYAQDTSKLEQSVVRKPEIDKYEDYTVNIHLQKQIISSLKQELNIKLEDLKKEHRKTKVVTKYIKLFRTVPVYVPVLDSADYVNMFPDDTLKNRYFIEEMDLHKTPPKHTSLLNKIFKKK